MSEDNAERFDEESDAIKFAYAEGIITFDFYRDLTRLLWQAKKTPELENEVTKLNHEIWKLRNGRVMKEWENDQLRIIAERKQLEMENERLREQVDYFEMKYENSGAIFGRQNMLGRIEGLEEENMRLREGIEKLMVKAEEHDSDLREMDANTVFLELYDLLKEESK